MRVWDQMDPRLLCRQHLLAQWREALGLWSIVAGGKRGYRDHPETGRWIGREPALYLLLNRTRLAMLERGWGPKPLPPRIHDEHQLDSGVLDCPPQWDDQLAVLRSKGCACRVPAVPA